MLAESCIPVIPIYWAPKDIHKTRERLKSLGYAV